MSGLTKELESTSISTARHNDILRSTGKNVPNKGRETTGTNERNKVAVTKAVVFATLYSVF